MLKLLGCLAQKRVHPSYNFFIKAQGMLLGILFISCLTPCGSTAELGLCCIHWGVFLPSKQQ
ncbi:Hypothetical protein FKW44_006888 [Caligus rogercresseyi]|uniref:Uncharacterized protein n=1 Tax=Caligus rogercresseyi TaxID=217165 RepID=A0A7T8KDX5_CALRO|nr:Hypothetical protein FKW44_006888 [Caligus rogercresseyi]